jgi:hypothetical protein
VRVTRDRNGVGSDVSSAPAPHPAGPAAGGPGQPRPHRGWRPSVASTSWAAPLAASALAAVLALSLETGWVSAGSESAEGLLVAFALGVVATSLALGSWHHRVMVRPLQRLARSLEEGAAHARGAPVVPGPALPRELALLDASLASVRAPTALERDRLTGLLASSGLREVAARELEAAR